MVDLCQFLELSFAEPFVVHLHWKVPDIPSRGDEQEFLPLPFGIDNRQNSMASLQSSNSTWLDDALWGSFMSEDSVMSCDRRSFGKRSASHGNNKKESKLEP